MESREEKLNTDVQEIERIRREYDLRDRQDFSSLYSYENPAFLFHMHERERVILNTLKKMNISVSQSSVLEVGCGTGHILERFLEFGARKATGIDLIGSRIQTGKEKYPNLHLIQGDASKLPFKEGEFDFVMQFMCLSSVLDPVIRKKIANEMWRVLRPGGTLLFYDLRPISQWNRSFFKLIQLLKIFRRSLRFEKKNERDSLNRPKPRTTPTYLMSSTEIRNLFDYGSFDIYSISLDLKFASLIKNSALITALLSRLPFLRTHYFALIRKPS